MSIATYDQARAAIAAAEGRTLATPPSSPP